MGTKLQVTDSIAVKYRPRTLADLVGNKKNIDIITGFFKKHQLVKTWLLAGDSGSGKCVVGNTLVATKNGLQYIKDIVGEDTEEGFTKKSVDLFTKDGIETASCTYKQRNCKTIKITSRLGYSVEGTPDHPIYVLSKDLSFKWKCLKNIETGDIICLSRSMEFPNETVKFPEFCFEKKPFDNSSKRYKVPTECSEELARLIGYMIANGSFDRGVINFCTSNEDVQKDYINIVNNLFGYQNLNFVAYSDKTPTCAIKSVFIYQFFEKIVKFHFGVASEKRIPNCILQSPKNVIYAFLSGYISCDSWMTGSYASNCVLTTASKDFGIQLHILLLHLGIVGRLDSFLSQASNSSNPTVRRYYRLRITAYHFSLLYPYLNLLKTFNKNKPVYTLEYYPGFIYDKYEEFQKYYEDNGQYPMYDLDGVKLKFSLKISLASNVRKCPFTYNTAITKRHYEAFCGKHEAISLVDPELGVKLKTMYNYDFLYDEVVDIVKFDSKKTVYDLTVPGSHSFIGNGIVIHNTTTARLIAMTVNCQNLGDDGTPCMECPSCKLALQDNHPDIIELNAAGEGGTVDSIRNVLQQIRLAPRFNFKVVILDECFPADTKVVLSDLSVTAIDKVKEGDSVLTYNIRANKIQTNKVIATKRTEIADLPILADVYLQDGSMQTCTINHKWWSVSRQRYVRADDLYNGEKLLFYREKEIATVLVEKVKWSKRDPEPVYDIEVESNHNFFIETNNGLRVLVSNCHGLTGKSKEEILKPLEQPPANTLWILCTTEPQKLPQATFGRCLKLYWSYPTNIEMSKRLYSISKKEYPEIVGILKPYLKEIAMAAGNQPRNSISLLECVASAIIANEKNSENIDDIITSLVSSMGELDSAVMRFTVYLFKGKKLVPINEIRNLEPSRINEFITLVFRYSYYAVLWSLHSIARKPLDKKKLWGVNWMKYDSLLQKVNVENLDIVAMRLCNSATLASEKLRLGLINPEQAAFLVISDYFSHAEA